MKRRWFLTGLALPVMVAGCRAASTASAPDTEAGLENAEGESIQVVRNNKTLVMATTANYPPYEQVLEQTTAGNDSESVNIVGFDIDIAKLIAERLERQLTIVDLEFGALIPALMNDEVDMAMAALEPNRSRKQKVDFSNIYYRARHALVSLDGYLRSRDLRYQTIGLLANSVQARYADTTDELGELDIVPYRTVREIFEALDMGAIEGALLEANVATAYLDRYPDFAAQLMPTEEATGSAIALPKNSSLRRDINRALSDIKASGEMDQLITQWFG
ncbi:MAG: transporter substrate-binding domain-containing protein [Cyanobacteria bacterium J06560_2]